MPNAYDKNTNLKKYFEDYINQMNIDKRYTSVLVDVMMRRAYQYELSPQEIKQDVIALLNNLNEIVIDDMPEGYEKANGIYSSDEKKITIKKEFAKQADNKVLYQTLTHEVYHVLTRDEDGNDQLAGYNSITGQYNSSLLEAIVEKASYRAVFGNDRQENIYFNQNANGYADITFIVDALEATYGVNEQDFLKNGIQGREQLANFLAANSGETIDTTLQFLDAIESNYALLHNSLYPWNEEEEKNMISESRNKNIKDALTGIYQLCENKISERMARISISNVQDAINLKEELNYDHNKLNLVMDDRIKYFSNVYDLSINNDVYQRVQPYRENTLYRINDLGSVLEVASQFPTEQDCVNAVDWARDGNLGQLDPQLLNYYEIERKMEYTLPITQEYIDKISEKKTFRRRYINSKLGKTLKNIANNKYKKIDTKENELEENSKDENKRDNILKKGIEKFKSIFLGRTTKLLGEGQEDINNQSTTDNNTNRSGSELFPPLTKEQQEYYNNQVKKAVEQTNSRNNYESKSRINAQDDISRD